MDKKTIHGIKNGNQESFKTFYDAYFEKALRSASAITKNKEMAKDAVQETFIRIYIHISSYDMTKPFAPWFYRILINECNRLLKKNSKLKLVNHPLEHSSIIKEDEKDFSDLYSAILSLKDIYRVPITLKYIQGFSEKDIAAILELNLNTVKSRLYKGREKLRITLKNYEEKE